MQFIKKSVADLQAEIQYYANDLIKISSAPPRSAPLSINARTIEMKLETLMSEASEQKIELLSRGEREIATLYAQEIDILAQLAAIFSRSDVENLGTKNSKLIDSLSRTLLSLAINTEKLFKETMIKQQIRAQYAQYSGGEARA